MARSLLLVHSNPAQGHEAEFDEWFVQHHLADVVALEGFRAGTFLRKADFQRNSAGLAHPFRNLAVYELDDPPDTGVQALDAASRLGALRLNPSLASHRLTVVYDVVSRIERP